MKFLLSLFGGANLDAPPCLNGIQQLQAWNLLHSKITCSKCDSMMMLFPKSTKDGFEWKCKNKMDGTARRCQFSRSIRKGTLFEGAQLSMQKIVLFMHLWIQNISLTVISNETCINNTTATVWGHKFLRIIEEIILNQSSKIGGPGKIVEIDESKFGRQKYHRGSPVEGQWVFGGIQHDDGRCFLLHVAKRDKATLLDAIKKYIEPGTIIYSDCWRAHNCSDYEGFLHLTVNHSMCFVDPGTGTHANTIETEWRHTKEDMPKYGLKKKDFTGYLAKHMFIKQCRVKGLDRTKEFLEEVGRYYAERID